MEKKQQCAAKLKKIQEEMSEITDNIAIETRRSVPYPSTYDGPRVCDLGPVPSDDHLVPSQHVRIRKPPPDFMDLDDEHEHLGISGKAYAMVPTFGDSIFIPKPLPGDPKKPVRQRSSEEKEMWKAQQNEWELQKNAFNPDIAAAQRTNVRKAAEMTVPPVDKPQDPARASENVRAALSDSSITGPAPRRSKMPLRFNDVYPAHMKPEFS